MQWNIKKASPLKLAKYKNRLGVSSIMAKVLHNRAIDIDTARLELNDPMALVELPTEITGAEAAAKAILEQCGKGKQFIIFADYDVDGLTSGYIMTDFLLSIGEDAIVHYPQRSEGYGLSMDFVKEVVDASANAVVITVDNGITKLNEVQYLNEHNIPVIVTDHHEPQGVLPDCVCCDPWTDKDSAGHHLCGAAVAWKVCMIMEYTIEKGDTEKYLPHVALATVADVMPMVAENIALVRLGLEAINNGKSRAISTLMEMLDIKTLTAGDIAWKIAPKLNSCGRMNSIDVAGELFFMEDADAIDIKDQVRDIIECDDERTKYTKRAQKAIEKMDYSQDNVCLFDASEYPAGIAGIIAGKITERFGKPSFVYTSFDSEVYSASARSIPFLDLGLLLNTELEKGNIHGWGGHAQACGVSLNPDRLNDFRTSMNKQIAMLIAECGDEAAEEPTLDVDAEISIKDLNSKLLKEIEMLPYDKATCPAPVFCMTGVKVKAKQPYSNKNHLVLDCEDKNGNTITLVMWNSYDSYAALGEPSVMDIAGTIETVGFPDRTTKRRATDVTLKIKDMRVA